MQVQDSAVNGTGASTAPNPALDVQQLQLEVNQFTIQSVNVAIGDEVGSTSYMKAGDMATVSVTVSSNGPGERDQLLPTVTVNALLGGTAGGPAPVVSCTGPVPASAPHLWHRHADV